MTFLLSSWQCIFGCGCQGIWTAPTPELGHGCCTYGAHFSDKADREHVVKVAKELGADEWQFAKVAKKKGIYTKVVEDEGDGPEWKTTIHKDACIFLNRLDFPAGAGCALHLHALNRGKHFSDYKPEVCWQVPLRRIDDEQDDGSVISRLTEFGRDGWGEGGEDFGWWCTEAARGVHRRRAGVPVDVGRAAQDARQAPAQAGRRLPRAAARGGGRVAAGRAPGRGPGEAGPQEVTGSGRAPGYR